MSALSREIEGEDSPAIIYEDNSSAIRIAEGNETSCSRFLLTKQYAIHQAVIENEIVIRKIPTLLQYADILTKALDGANFARIRDFLLTNCIPLK